jgi:hypothetical protein
LNYYTKAEDASLLKFVSQHERYTEAGGVQLWRLMERKQAVPGKEALLIGMFMKVILVQ